MHTSNRSSGLSVRHAGLASRLFTTLGLLGVGGAALVLPGCAADPDGQATALASSASLARAQRATLTVELLGVASSPIEITRSGETTATFSGTVTNGQRLKFASGTYVVDPGPLAGYVEPAIQTISVSGSTRVSIQYVASGTPPPGDVCGDGICQASESCSSCAADCACAIQIPSQSAWIDRGQVLAAGAPGAWDHLLWGAFALSAVRMNGTTYLYYQGAESYDDVYETVRYRSIGVATSSDGITFQKYGTKPVLTWAPNNWLEEGAVSIGAFAGPTGITAFYGANTKVDDWQVNANGRYATSTNGLSFTDQGIALDRTNTSIWASGDELFPILAFAHEGIWYVYYLPNGTSVYRKLGVAWGSQPTSLTTSRAVQDRSGALVSAWGPSGAVHLGSGDYAIVTSYNGVTIVWKMNVRAPDTFTLATTYQFADAKDATMLLDGDTWYFYYRTAPDMTAIRVRTAKAY
jgi:hypothetical protein